MSTIIRLLIGLRRIAAHKRSLRQELTTPCAAVIVEAIKRAIAKWVEGFAGRLMTSR